MRLQGAIITSGETGKRPLLSLSQREDATVGIGTNFLAANSACQTPDADNLTNAGCWPNNGSLIPRLRHGSFQCSENR
jgi:hypothetical protein